MCFVLYDVGYYFYECGEYFVGAVDESEVGGGEFLPECYGEFVGGFFLFFDSCL